MKTRKDILDFFKNIEIVRDNNHIPPLYKLSPVSCESIADYIEANQKQDSIIIKELKKEIKELKDKVALLEMAI